MSDLDKMFAHDIKMYLLKHETPMDALADKIHGALRAALISGECGPFSSFRDSPEGITELDGAYDLAFVARVIRSVLP